MMFVHFLSYRQYNEFETKKALHQKVRPEYIKYPFKPAEKAPKVTEADEKEIADRLFRKARDGRS